MQDPGATFFPAAAPPFPQLEPHHLRCPRCDSTDTKFCYYNNYNLAQPRHFCRSCRRYWTRGGTLRNVPVGGASRKTAKRPSPSKRSTNPPAAPAAPPQQIPATHPTPPSTGRFGDPLATFHSGEAPPAVDASLRLRGDPATRGAGGGLPDLAIYAPGSEF